MAYQASSRHSESLLEMDDHLEEIFKSLFRDFIRIFLFLERSWETQLNGYSSELQLLLTVEPMFYEL